MRPAQLTVTWTRDSYSPSAYRYGKASIPPEQARATAADLLPKPHRSHLIASDVHSPNSAV